MGLSGDFHVHTDSSTKCVCYCIIFNENGQWDKQTVFYLFRAMALMKVTSCSLSISRLPL